MLHLYGRRADFEPVQAQGVVYVDLASLMQRQDVAPGLFLADRLDLDAVKIVEFDPRFRIIVEPPDVHQSDVKGEASFAQGIVTLSK